MTLSTRQAEIIEAARRQIDAEIHSALVSREVARMRASANKSLWQRLIEKLPFTIQVSWRKP